VLRPKNDSPDLWILHDGHLYFSESLVNQADDKVLTALLAHGVAHYELRHHTKREVARGLGMMASAVGGVFLPGLQAAALVTDPAMERLMSAGQEFIADTRAVTYLNPLGHSIDNYVRALQFLAAHAQTERTGSIMTTQEGFSLRIATLRKRQALQPATTPSADETQESPP
jgi:Zn-dependent protease with chaperone function